MSRAISDNAGKLAAQILKLTVGAGTASAVSLLIDDTAWWAQLAKDAGVETPDRATIDANIQRVRRLEVAEVRIAS